MIFFLFFFFELQKFFLKNSLCFVSLSLFLNLLSSLPSSLPHLFLSPTPPQPPPPLILAHSLSLLRLISASCSSETPGRCPLSPTT